MKKLSTLVIIYLFLLNCFVCKQNINAQSFNKVMMFGDTTRKGIPFSKDPHVIKFKEKYIMYYSVPPYSNKSNPIKGWGIGIAESNDLINWRKIGEIIP